MMQSPDELLGQLKGVTGPESAPPSDQSSLPIWFFVTAVALIAFMFWLRFRRKWIEPLPDAADEASEALAALSDVPDLEALDHIGRRYLGRAYRIPAERLTTSELMHWLPEAIAAAWRNIFESSDRARFSGITIDTTEWNAFRDQIGPLIQDVSADSADE